MARQPFRIRAGLKIAAIYVSVAAILVLVSDWLIYRSIQDPSVRATWQTGTELFFVAGTGMLIMGLVWRELARREGLEERHRVLANQDLVGVFVTQGEKLVFANPKLGEMFGYGEGELMEGVTFEELVDPDDLAMVRDRLSRVQAGEIEETQYTVTGLRKDGLEIRVEVHGGHATWEDGPAVMGVAMDITEQEKAEEQRRRSQKLEMLGKMTAAVAHDFNNLLTAIIAPMDLCTDLLDPDHPAAEEIEEARNSAERAVTITRKLLTFSRRTIHQPQPIDLNALIRDMEPMLKRLGNSGVQVEVDLQDGLPAVEVDPSQFQQVILNLVMNGADATQNDGRVRIRTLSNENESAAEEVVLEVSDDGIGMDEETQLQIFDPFFTTKQSGTGLGLATVHGIIKECGGTLSVDSSPGKGATFRLQLLASSKEPEPLDGAGSDDEPDGEFEHSGTVLVVEDEDAVRRITVRVLERAGYRVLETGDPVVAESIARDNESELDVVLCDIGLPGTNGVDLVDRLKTFAPGFLPIYMSGYSDKEVLGRLSKRDEVWFLEKPFNVSGLLQFMKKVQKGRGSKQPNSESDSMSR